MEVAPACNGSSKLLPVAADPSNATWHRELWVSCCRMADVAEKTANPESQPWSQRTYEILASIKTRGR